MRMHISETMIDASYEVCIQEAVADGMTREEMEEDPQKVARFRQVLRAMLQAAADVAAQRS